jgi:hypothetical protein
MLATMAEVRTAYAKAMAAASAQQNEAGRFIQENGHEVVGGHADVGRVESHDIGQDNDGDA